MKKKINNLRRNLLRSLTKHIKGKAVELDPTDDILQRPLRVLISRPNSRLGNLLMVTPLVQEIERLLPNAKIDLFVRGGVGFPIFENYKSVNKLIVLPSKPFKELGKYLKVWWSIKKEDYDLVLNVIPDSSSGRLSAQLSKASMKDFGDELESLKSEYPDYIHMAKQPVYNLRHLLSQWGIDSLDATIPNLSFNLTQQELLNGDKVYRQIIPEDKPTIYIYTFATGNKCLTTAWWTTFYDKLKAEFPDYNIIEVLPKEKVSQINFAAPSYYSTDLHEMVATISKGDLFITADCGVMHLASASNLPVLALFNITSIERYGPYNKGSKAVYSDKVTQEELIQLSKDILQRQ